MRAPVGAAIAIAAAAVVTAPGCFWLAAGSAVGETTADTATGAVNAGSLGSLDGELLEEITDTAAIQQLDAKVDGRGAVVAVALRHFDGPAIPPAVRALVSERFPGASLVFFGTTYEAGQTVLYEALVQIGEDRQCLLAVEGDGSLVHTECDVEATSLPPLVTAAAERIGAGEIVRVAQRDSTAQIVFVVEKRVAHRTHVLELNANGDILEHDVLLPATIRIPYLGRPLHQVDPDAIRGDSADGPEDAVDAQVGAAEPSADAVSPE